MIGDAVILGAGSGTRLGPREVDGPKCLVEVGGRSLLEHQVRRLRAVGVTRVTVVGGYRIERLRSAARALAAAAGVEVEVVESPAWASTNTAYSARLGLARAPDGAYLLNGDVLFPRRLLEALADRADRPTAFAIEPGRCGAEEVKVQVDGQDRIQAISKRLDPTACLGEYVGVARLGAGALPDILAALDAIAAAGHDAAYFEDGLERAIGRVDLWAVRVDAPVVEIDFPEDLARARDEIHPRILVEESS